MIKHRIVIILLLLTFLPLFAFARMQEVGPARYVYGKLINNTPLSPNFKFAMAADPNSSGNIQFNFNDKIGYYELELIDKPNYSTIVYVTYDNSATGNIEKLCQLTYSFSQNNRLNFQVITLPGSFIQCDRVSQNTQDMSMRLISKG